MQWVQYSIQSSADNLNNVRQLADISGKRKEYLQVKMEELETKSKIKNILDLYRGISDFKMGYQHRTLILKNGKDNCRLLQQFGYVEEPFLSTIIYIYGFNDIRQIEIHTAEPLVPEPSALKLSWLLKS